MEDQKPSQMLPSSMFLGELIDCVAAAVSAMETSLSKLVGYTRLFPFFFFLDCLHSPKQSPPSAAPRRFDGMPSCTHTQLCAILKRSQARENVSHSATAMEPDHCGQLAELGCASAHPRHDPTPLSGPSRDYPTTATEH
jgi:hypothetical protein